MAKTRKRRWIFILSKKIKYYTKETIKYFNIVLISLGVIIGIILVKYKPSYKISINGEEIGYLNNKSALNEVIKSEILEANKAKNIDSIDINLDPNYELKLVDRKIETNKIEMSEDLEKGINVTYNWFCKYNWRSRTISKYSKRRRYRCIRTKHYWEIYF